MVLYSLVLSRRLSEARIFVALRFSHQLADIKDEYTGYLPITDMSEEGRKRHQRQLWYDSIKAFPTVEQKLYELAVQQRLNLKTYVLSSVAPTYSCVNFQQYITRTRVINDIPDKLKRMNVDAELDEIKSFLCDILVKYYYNVWAQDKSKKLQDYLNENEAGSKLVKAFIAQCYKKLAAKNDYILESTIQNKPRINSFWWHSGFESKHNKLYETNLCFQFQDFPSFFLRMKKPLSPILDINDPLCSTADVENFHYHPKVFGIPFKKNCIRSIPGFWPDDPYKFPLLLVYTSDGLQNLLSKINNYDLMKIEEGVGTMSSFALLNSVATYQGFTPFHDVTYPFVTQTVVTNGQDWNFFLYQMNTFSFHSDVDKKDRRNICWSMGKLRLFDTIENGEVKGINDEVFKMLLKFLLNAPEVKDNLNLSPYLGVDLRNEEDKFNTHYFFREMYSLRPASDAHKEEIPTWQRIYKMHPDAPPSPFVRLE